MLIVLNDPKQPHFITCVYVRDIRFWLLTAHVSILSYCSQLIHQNVQFNSDHTDANINITYRVVFLNGSELLKSYSPVTGLYSEFIQLRQFIDNLLLWVSFIRLLIAGAGAGCLALERLQTVIVTNRINTTERKV